MHHRGRPDDREQSGDDEQLALAQAPDKAEQRIENEAAHKRPTRSPRAPCRARASSRPARSGPAHSRHRSDDRDHRNDREVLEQQDREGALALRRVELIVRTKHRKHLSCRGKRERQTDRQRCLGREAAASDRAAADRQPAKDDLRQAQAENVLAQTPEPARLELEPDDEQEKRDADVRDACELLGIADQP